MLKLFRKLCVAGLFVLLLTGVSFALVDQAALEGDGIDYTFMDPYFYASPWATLHVELAVSGEALYSSGFNTLMYTLSVEYPLDVHSLELPFILGSGATYGQESGSGVSYESVTENFWGTLQFDWGAAGIAQGESSNLFWVRDDLGVDIGTAFLWNGGGPSVAEAAALLVGFGGGGGTQVPEPATLLLLGAGFLGMGAFRYLKRRSL